MADKAWQKESFKQASWFTSYKQCKMQQNNTGSRLSENQENRAETDLSCYTNRSKTICKSAAKGHSNIWE